MNTLTRSLASSRPTGHSVVLRRFCQSVPRLFPFTSRRQGFLELARGYDRMAGQRASTGDELGARCYGAHARAMREVVSGF